MSRYRLLPTPAQEAVLRDHCAHARFVWNLAVEQHSHWHPGRVSAPGYLEQCRQLTAARADHPWLAEGSQMVQQQALRDFAQAMTAFFDPQNPAGRPTWRKAGRDEGFRIVGWRGRQWNVRRLSRKTGEVWAPKAGWVRFRWSRAVPEGVKSYRVTMDRAGRWHIAFAAIPEPIPAPGNGEAVGIDRGVLVSAALSTGELLHVPGLTARERKRLRRLERKLPRARRGSNRRTRTRLAMARLKARETDRRKDWAEKASTDIARRFDLIRFEDLQIKNMTRSARGTRENPGRNVGQKTGLNRGILRSGWGLLVALAPAGNLRRSYMVRLARRPMTEAPRDQDRQHRRRHRAVADQPRRRYRLRDTRRADLPVVRRDGARGAAGDRRAARAVGRLHGVRLRAGDGPDRCLLGGARPRVPELQRRPDLGLRGQRPGGVHHRGDPVGVHRPRPRPPARAARPAGDDALADQVGGHGRAPRPGQRADRAGVLPRQVGTAAADRDRRPVGRAGRAGGRGQRRAAGARAPAGTRPLGHRRGRP